MSATILKVLERLAAWSRIDFDPHSARHSLHMAEREHPGAHWIDVLTTAGKDVGLRIQAIRSTPREAIKLANAGRLMVGHSPELDRWYLLTGGSLGRARLVMLGPGEYDRELGVSGLAKMLKVDHVDDTIEWVVSQPLAPAQGLESPTKKDQGHDAHDGEHEVIWHHSGTPEHHDLGYREPLLRLFTFLRPDMTDIRMVVVFAMSVAFLSLATPLAVESLVMTVGFRMLLQQVVVLAILLMAFLSLSAAMLIIQKVLVEYLQRRFFVRIVADLAYRLPRVQLGAIDRGVGPELANRFFDVMTVQKAFAVLLVDGVSLVLTTIFGLTVMAFYHPYLLGFDLVLVASIVVFVLLLGRRGVITAALESIFKYQTAAWIEELARNPIAFKFGAGPELALQRADEVAKEWLLARREHFRVVYRQVLFTSILHVIASTALLGLGGWLVIQGQLTLGQLVASELIVATIVGSFAKIGKYVENYYDLLAAINKLGILVDLPLDPEGDEDHRGPSPGATVTLRRVSYTYDGHHPVIDHLSTIIGAGDRVAIVGPAGTGKSTLLEIMMKARMPTSGQIEFDGMDYRDLRTDALRRQIGVARGIEVIEGTILQNVRVGRDEIPLSEIRSLLEAVGLWDEVSSHPHGIDMRLTPGGGPLSPGQLRRLMLARAMAGQPRLILIDEVLDGLDEEIRQDVATRLFDRDAPWTVVIVTRDKELIARCDRTIEMPEPSDHTHDGHPPSAMATRNVTS